mmetsp:Transcript_35441/g.105918  ORF Transcript_35441/g.105918 Transcript_35441/m.105918 type:complete len:200 (-) Transcript_35441:652-1251(-)
MPQPSVWGSATKRSTAAAWAAPSPRDPSTKEALSSSTTFRAISPLQRDVGSTRPSRSEPRGRSARPRKSWASAAARSPSSLLSRARGEPSRSPISSSAKSAPGPSSAHSRQMETCECPACSPTDRPPEATRTRSVKSRSPRSSMETPSSWNWPALKSMSRSRSRCRSVVVMILIVGTNGKFVMDPLPVTKKIALQPQAT